MQISRAKSEIDVLLPGYTHLQRAQPIRWSQSGGATGSCVTPLLCSETCKDWIRWTYI